MVSKKRNKNKKPKGSKWNARAHPRKKNGQFKRK